MTRFHPYHRAMPDYFETPGDGVAFRVNGTPAPQGSKRAFVVNGHAVLTEASQKVNGQVCSLSVLKVYGIPGADITVKAIDRVEEAAA